MVSKSLRILLEVAVDGQLGGSLPLYQAYAAVLAGLVLWCLHVSSVSAMNHPIRLKAFAHALVDGQLVLHWKIWSLWSVQVYKAELDGYKEVAVKFLIPSSHAGDARSMKKFADEIGIMRACRDGNVVGFIGAWLQTVRCSSRFHPCCRCMLATTHSPNLGHADHELGMMQCRPGTGGQTHRICCSQLVSCTHNSNVV